MFFKSGENWEFGSKAIDFLENAANVLADVSWNRWEGAGFSQHGAGCSVRLRRDPWPGVAVFSWLLPAWLGWWLPSLGLWSGIFISWECCFGYSSRCVCVCTRK